MEPTALPTQEQIRASVRVMHTTRTPLRYLKPDESAKPTHTRGSCKRASTRTYEINATAFLQAGRNVEASAERISSAAGEAGPLQRLVRPWRVLPGPVSSIAPVLRRLRDTRARFKVVRVRTTTTGDDCLTQRESRTLVPKTLPSGPNPTDFFRALRNKRHGRDCAGELRLPPLGASQRRDLAMQSRHMRRGVTPPGLTNKFSGRRSRSAATPC